MKPEGEFSKPDDTSDENTEEVFEHKKGVTIGPVLIVLLSVVCLAVVFWFIYTIWSTDTPVAQEPPVDTPIAEEVEDITVIPDRDPSILGLRIDAVAGRFFTESATGRALYVVEDNDCSGDCLENWTPYTTEVAVVNGGNLGTAVRSDTEELQYTWKGQTLYTFNLDTERSVFGDGYEGKWRIARP